MLLKAMKWKNSFQQQSNSSSSEDKDVVDPNMTLSEKLQNIIDKCNEAEKFSNTEQNQNFAKKN